MTNAIRADNLVDAGRNLVDVKLPIWQLWIDLAHGTTSLMKPCPMSGSGSRDRADRKRARPYLERSQCLTPVSGGTARAPSGVPAGEKNAKRRFPEAVNSLPSLQHSARRPAEDAVVRGPIASERGRSSSCGIIFFSNRRSTAHDPACLFVDECPHPIEFIVQRRLIRRRDGVIISA